MLRIKLSRIGRKNNPKYRIVIAEAKSKRDGKYADKIGFYDPVAEPTVLTVDQNKLKNWIKLGAQPSKGIQRLLAKYLN
ncbi:MAG: 30S ribosomal protein S16 [Candidatus Paceibacterota bacterium]